MAKTKKDNQKVDETEFYKEVEFMDEVLKEEGVVGYQDSIAMSVHTKEEVTLNGMTIKHN